jgi:hypothetical protein
MEYHRRSFTAAWQTESYMTSCATNSVAVGRKADIQIPAGVHSRVAVAALHKHCETPGTGAEGAPVGSLVAGCDREEHLVVG